MRNRRLIAIVIVALLVTATLQLHRDKEATPSSQTLNQSSEVKPTSPRREVNLSQNIEEATIAYSTPLSHDQMVVSESLRGTDIDGALQADSLGHLILNLGVRDFFDYFLSTSDEIGPEAAIDEIVRYAKTYLPKPAEDEAVSLLQNYLRYKREEFSVEQTPLNSGTLSDQIALELLEQSFVRLREKRAVLFSPAEEKALFELEDINAELTLASLQINADPELNLEEKQLKAEAIMLTLPPDLKASKHADSAQLTRQAQLDEALNSTIDDTELYQRLDLAGFSKIQSNQIVTRRQQQIEFERRYQEYQAASQNQKDKESLRKQYFFIPEEQTQAALRDLRTQ